MQRPARTVLLLLSSLAVLISCSGFDEEAARAEIRERFCDRWPYGCSESTEIVVKRVRKAGAGRLVDFRIVDGSDKTGMLSAAYFGERESGWEFFSFDNPFREVFEHRTNEINADRKHLTDLLIDLRAKQNWHLAIYGRYAASFEELASRVRYTASFDGVKMIVAEDGESFQTTTTSQYFTCQADDSRHFPKCQLHVDGDDAGKPRALSKTFGAD